jgi:FkbM family methyltransferase
VAIDIWSRRHFERNELEFILNVLQPGMTFVDVGANVGLFSLPAARKVQHGKVFAFEPTRSTYELLARNVQINSLKNLRAFHSALGDYVGEAVLQVNVRGKDGLNTLGRPTHESSEVIGKETVPITTLDHFMDRHGIARVDAMKVDVEGAELFVFRGAENLLRRADAPLILYEGGFLSKGFDYHPVEQMWLLEKHGYCLFVIDSGSGQVSRPTARRAYNAMVIAVKPTHPRYEAVQERVR